MSFEQLTEGNPHLAHYARLVAEQRDEIEMLRAFAHLPALPAEYREALRYARDTLSLDPILACPFKVVLAGGCLRDLMTGRPRKDIDVFVFGWDKPPDGEFAKLFGMDPEQQMDSSGPMASTRVVRDDLGYDLIAPHPTLIPDATALLDSFDVGICRIAHTGAAWVIHQDFLDDLRDRVIKVRSLGAHTVQSVRDHVARLQGYYPGFSVDTSFLDKAEAGWV